MRKTMVSATRKGTREEQLETLSVVLAKAIDTCDDSKSLAQLSRQYRETVRELEELKGMGAGDDEIGEILTERQADGKSGAVRKNRAGV